ncbi:MAG: VWA domain-containing protein [Pyrinomonadaceae bacterium]
MKNFAALVLIAATLAFKAFGQGSTATRPRVSPTATPPRIANDTYPKPAPSGPPVLAGGSIRPIPTPTPQAGDDDIIKVETNLVTMPVSVLDRDGRFISGLQQKDFSIFENGVEQKVDYFQSVEQPFTVIILIDVSPSTAFRIEEIQNAAITFVDQLRPADRVMVISFDESVHVLTPVTNNRYQLKNAIRQAEFGDGTSLYEAVDFVIENQLRQIQGRKAVVLFTDGVDTTSRRANYQSTVRKTEEIDALFYTIRYDTSGDMNGGGRSNGGYPQPGRSGRVSMADILGAILSGGNINIGGGGGGASSRQYETGRTYLEALAQNSGGRKFEAKSIYNVDSAFSGIAEELRRQYSLGYYPETVGNVGDRKQIKIRVMRQNVVVRAKNSYIVGQTNRNVAGK